MKKIKNNKFLSITFIFTIIRILLVVTGLTFLLIGLKKNNVDIDLTAAITWLTIFALVFISFAIFCVLNYFLLEKNNWSQQIILSILSLNIEIFIASILFRRKHKEEFTKFNFRFRFNSWKTSDIAIMSMILALFALFNVISDFIPTLPFFITLPIKYIPLLFGAYFLRFTNIMTVCFIAGALTWVMPATWIVNFWSWLFDYFLSVFCVCIAAFFKPNIKANKFNQTISWFVFVTIPVILIYVFRVTSGVLFYFADAWEGYDVWSYSLVLNSFNTITDYVGLLIVMPVVCTTLKTVIDRYYSNVQDEQKIEASQ